MMNGPGIIATNSAVSDEVVEIIREHFGDLEPRRIDLLGKLLPRVGVALDEVRSSLKEYKSAAAFLASLIERTVVAGGMTVAIVYHPHSWSQIGDETLQDLEAEGINVVRLMFPDVRDWDQGFLPVDQEIVELLRTIDVYVGTSLPQWLVTKADLHGKPKVINIDRTARTFFDPENPSRKYQSALMLRWAEHVVLPVPGSATKRKSVPLNEIKLPRDIISKRAHSYIVPFVPSKLERISEARAKLSDHDKKSILVCPSVSNLGAYFVKEYGDTIIGGLLARFPTHNIVFRPRPEDRENEEVITLREKYGYIKNFKFDDSDDVADTYSRGVLLITDRSSTGQTFALATRAPSISFPADGGFDGVTIHRLRGNGCFRVSSVDELFGRCAEILGEPGRWSDAIEEIYQKMYAGNASFRRHFPQLIKNVVNGCVDDDWFKIFLPEKNIVSSDVAGYEESISSILKDKWISADIYAFDIIPRYLEMKKNLLEPIPVEIVKRATELYGIHYVEDHSTYEVISRPVGMALNNLSLSIEDADALECLRKCAISLSRRNNQSVTERIIEDITRIPELEDYWREWLSPLNKEIS